MKIDIFCEGDITLPYYDLTRKYLKIIIKKTCKYLDLKNEYISLILTDNNYIQELNNNYRKKNYPTDVISFPYKEDQDIKFPGEKKLKEPLGDIYLSLEKALTQSEEYDVTFNNEVKRLIVHGILHLIGYDHELSEYEDKKMRQKEEEILKLVSSQ